VSFRWTNWEGHYDASETGGASHYNGFPTQAESEDELLGTRKSYYVDGARA